MKAIDDYLDPCEVVIDLARTNYGSDVLPQHRVGVMLHYDASKTDQGAINWFDDPAFKLSYNRAYTDNGRRIRLTPTMTKRAYHAGRCKTDTKVTRAGGANGAFYGLCVTAGDHQPLHPNTGAVVTEAQFQAIVYDTAVIARWHQLRGDAGWAVDQIDYWLTGHNEWACDETGRLGRKVDPKGTMKTADVLPINSGRAAVAILLASLDHPLFTRFHGV